MDAAPYSFTLYGSDNYINCLACSLATKSSIEALSGLATADMTAYFIQPHWKDDGETYDAGNVRYKDGRRRGAFEIKSAFYEFPDDDDDIATVETALNKQFHWIEVTDFPREIHPDNYVVAVVINDELSLENYGKQFVLNCEYMKNG